ncbi:hypothetical protein EON82_08650 [bacterium]|nr:MAG: hypothetical protein EON82_08650 [bacterium]
MKRKNDDLLRLAFGELSADAAQAVEAQAAADPAARRELEACRDLRAGLQHLPPPPPDGLSTERLRAAILDRELKTRRPSFVPLAWAPMALAAIAAVVLFVRPASQSDPTIVAQTGDLSYKKLIKAPEFKTPPAAMTMAAKQGEKKNVVPTPVERVASAAAQDETAVRPAANRRRVRSGHGAVKTFAYVPPTRSKGGEKLPEYVLNPIPDTIAPPSSIVAPNDGGRVATNSDDTVVIISTQRDLETGAHAASETEAGSVLVGG